jgi:hypothetical protein
MKIILWYERLMVTIRQRRTAHVQENYFYYLQKIISSVHSSRSSFYFVALASDYLRGYISAQPSFFFFPPSELYYLFAGIPIDNANNVYMSCDRGTNDTPTV